MLTTGEGYTKPLHLSQYSLSKLESSTVCLGAKQSSLMSLIDHLGLDSVLCCQIVTMFVGLQPVNQAGRTHKSVFSSSFTSP